MKEKLKELGNYAVIAAVFGASYYGAFRLIEAVINKVNCRMCKSRNCFLDEEEPCE